VDIKYPVLLFPVRLETRFIGNELLIRVYPDDVLIESHDDHVTPEEKEALSHYKSGLTKATNDEFRKAAWRALVRRVGRTRAAYLSGINDLHKVQEKPDGWNFSHRVRLLPSRFLFCLYNGNNHNPKISDGNPIPRDSLPLPLMRHPSSEPSGSAPLLGKEAAWVSDFQAAEKIGMAKRIKLNGGENYFSRLVVIGLNDNDDQNKSQKLLEEHFKGIRFTTGFSLLPNGTPTNNTADQGSGYTDDDKDTEASYEIENKDLLKSAAGTSWGTALATALGVSSEVFKHVAHADKRVTTFAKNMQTALWPALGDYFVTHMIPNPLSPERRRQLWTHFSELVRASGHLPALRVGKQPYGILPVTGITDWKASALDRSVLPEFSAEQSVEFDKKLHTTLKILFDRWLGIAQNSSLVPRIGNGQDSDEELLQVLSMQPSSISQHIRAIVDDRYVNWHFKTFGDYFFGNGSNFKSKSSAEVWLQKWREARGRAVQLLKTIAQEHNLPFEALTGAKILSCFPGDSGTAIDDLGLSLIKDSTVNGKALKYLEQFLPATPGIPSADRNKPLLYDLLRRALIYQQQAEEYRLPYGFLLTPVSHMVSFLGATVGDVHVKAGGPVKVKDPLVSIIEFSGPETIRSSFAGKVTQIYVKKGDRLTRNTNVKLLDLYGFHYADTAVRQSVQVLKQSGLSPESLEELVRDTLDLHSHRLDAWLTSLAMKRLIAMRKDSPQGIYIGAYGWVEDLRRDERTTGAEEGGYIHAPSSAQAAAAAVLRNAYLTHTDDDNGNAFRINLSSNRVRRAWRLLDGLREGQELRALLGYQFERGLHDKGQDKYIDNFRSLYPVVPVTASETNDSTPVETLVARNVVDGLLLVREWTEYNDPETTTKRKGDIQEDWKKQIDINYLSVEVRSELDRLADSLDALMDLLMYEAVYQEVQGNYERSGAALNAIVGEGVPQEPESIQTPAEGVAFSQRVCMLIQEQKIAFQGPRGDAEPSLAAWFAFLLGNMASIGCTAWVGTCRDDEFKEYKPIDLNHAKNSELETLPGITPELAQAIVARRPFGKVRDLLRVPGIQEAMLKQLSGRVAVYEAQVVWLTDLKLAPIDFLYLCSALPEALLSSLGFQEPARDDQRAGETEIEQRIKYFVREQNMLGPHCEVMIDFRRQPGKISRGFGEAMEFGQTVFKMLASGKYLMPASLRRPEEHNEAASFSISSYDELKSRVTAARDSLSGLPNDSFFELNRYGIKGAIPPPSPNDPNYSSRMEAIQKEIKKHITLCGQCLEEAKTKTEGIDPDYNTGIASLVKAMKALFGSEFIVLPTIELPAQTANQLSDAFGNQQTLLIRDEERVCQWLQQVAQTHMPVRKLEDALLHIDAWRTAAIDESSNCLRPPADFTQPDAYELRVAQLPQNGSRYWLALADEEVEGQLKPEEIDKLRKDIAENGWPRAILSIGCVVSPKIDMKKPIAGLLIDEWNELIPSATRTTGISFQYDRPNTQAPQALLIAVPSDRDNPSANWSEKEIIQTVNDTADLMKVRAVDVDALDEAVGRFLPAMILPADAAKPGWLREQKMPGLGE
jgi:hypothetical protein